LDENRQNDLSDRTEVESGESEGLHSQAFSVWGRIELPLDEEWRELDSAPIETLLLKIERERSTGTLELVGPKNATNIRFQHGFISGVRDRDHRDAGWTDQDLIALLLGWRSGKFRLVETEKIAADPGFPLRPRKLLTLAWLLLMDPRDRFLRKQELFRDFSRPESRRPTDILLGQILAARIDGKSGELQVRSRRNGIRVTFVDGNLAGIDTDEPVDLLNKICTRFGLIPGDRLPELLAECERTRKKLITVAIERHFLDGVSLELLHAMADWEEIVGCFQWHGLHSFWGGEEGEKAAEPDEERPEEVERAVPASVESPAPDFVSRPVVSRVQDPGEGIASSNPWVARIAVGGLLTLGVVGLGYYFTGKNGTPPPPKENVSMVPESKQSNGEATVLTVAGNTVSLRMAEVESCWVDVGKDVVAIKTLTQDVEIPFSEVKKFPPDAERSLNLIRRTFRRR
jgi:hypothetical protein